MRNARTRRCRDSAASGERKSRSSRPPPLPPEEGAVPVAVDRLSPPEDAVVVRRLFEAAMEEARSGDDGLPGATVVDVATGLMSALLETETGAGGGPEVAGALPAGDTRPVYCGMILTDPGAAPALARPPPAPPPAAIRADAEVVAAAAAAARRAGV